jgi:hypothetical protein
VSNLESRATQEESTKRLDRMDAQGECVNALRRQEGIEGPRWQTAAISEETTTEKHGKCYQDLQEVHLSRVLGSPFTIFGAPPPVRLVTSAVDQILFPS